MMDEFLKVINGIDWDMLHDQKREVLQLIDDQERVFGKAEQKPHKLEGLVNLLDDLQDVAAKLRIWTFPTERYDGNCPECDGRNYEVLEEVAKERAVDYECYDCGKKFRISEKRTVEFGWWNGGSGDPRRVKVVNCDNNTVYFYSDKTGIHYQWNIKNFLEEYEKEN
jgi:hypothetical protein